MNGIYGAGLLAFERIGEMMPTIAGAVAIIAAVGFISWCRS